MKEIGKSRKALLVLLLALILALSVFVSLKVDYDNRDRLFQSMIRDNEDAMLAFLKLGEVTPPDAIVFSWWDYGRAVQEYGGRKAVVAYPSRDITQSIGASQNPLYALEMSLFGTFESSEKIHDVATAFLVPEDESTAIMRKYQATYVMVFHGHDDRGAFNDLEKFAWIAKIAGFNASDYVRIASTSPRLSYQLTSKAEQVTMMRLLFDDTFPPQHFTKVYENAVTKIYRIEYSLFVDSTFQLGRLWSAFARGQLTAASPAEASSAIVTRPERVQWRFRGSADLEDR